MFRTAQDASEIILRRFYHKQTKIQQFLCSLQQSKDPVQKHVHWHCSCQFSTMKDKSMKNFICKGNSTKHLASCSHFVSKCFLSQRKSDLSLQKFIAITASHKWSKTSDMLTHMDKYSHRDFLIYSLSAEQPYIRLAPVDDASSLISTFKRRGNEINVKQMDKRNDCGKTRHD